MSEQASFSSKIVAAVVAQVIGYLGLVASWLVLSLPFAALSEPVTLAIINASVSIFTLVASSLATYLAYLAAQQSREARIMGEKNSEKIEVIHKATNSMKDELVSEVRKAAFAQGAKEAEDDKGKGKPDGIKAAKITIDTADVKIGKQV